MKKFLGFILAFFLLYFLTSPVQAFDKNKAVGVLNLPDEAKTKDVVSLGRFKDAKTGRDVQGYAFIHRGSKKSKSLVPSTQSNTKPGLATASASPATTSALPPCFGYTLGANWKNLGTPWIINPQNSRGLTSQFLLDTQSANIAKWEDAADGTIGDGQSLDILGNGSITNATLTGIYNGQNEVFFGRSSIPGAVAVTIAWGYFDGRLADRRIIEWEQIYNDVDYDFSASGQADKYDFENISTHELGHVMGLWDQYDSACLEATMFGYAALGETKKRTLETPDVSGVKELYEAENTDNDRDGFTNLVERYMGTDANAACGVNAWPPDVDGDGAVTILDMTNVANAFLTRIGDLKYNKRLDMDADGAITILDMTVVSNYFLQQCTNPVMAPLASRPNVADFIPKQSPTPAPTATPAPISCLKLDVNDDLAVDSSDTLLVLKHFGESGPSPYDVNDKDGVDNTDALLVHKAFGMECK